MLQNTSDPKADKKVDTSSQAAEVERQLLMIWYFRADHCKSKLLGIKNRGEDDILSFKSAFDGARALLFLPHWPHLILHKLLSNQFQLSPVIRVIFIIFSITTVDIKGCELLPSPHSHLHLRTPAAQQVTGKRMCHVHRRGGMDRSLQIDRVPAGVLWSNLLLNLALGFLLGCQVNMRDLGKETFGKVCNAVRMREAEGAQVVVRCPLMEKHSQCTWRMCREGAVWKTSDSLYTFRLWEIISDQAQITLFK